MDDPLPKFSFVISSANHIESIEPVVSDKIILSANNKLQLKLTGLTNKKAQALLKIKAQPKVKYFV